MQTIKPALKQLFCKPEEAEKKTASGLFLMGDGIEKPKIAEVIRTGSKVTEFKQGDRIVYKPYSTTDIKLNNTDYFLIADDDVLGVVVDE